MPVPRFYSVFLGLLTGFSLLSGCTRTTAIQSISAAPVPVARPTAPRVEQPTAPTRAWGGDAIPPLFEFARRYSPMYYERFASRSLFIEGLAAKIARATVPTKLHAVELDAFFDDHYYRDGELVMLDVDSEVATAFASRCYVDITYPTPKLHQDGFGGTEWGASYLTLIRDREQRTRALRLVSTKRRPAAVEPGTAYYRKFEDNDAVLLYFHPRDLTPLAPGGVDSMRLENADREVERIVRESTEIFGQEYVLLSKTCFKQLKDAVPEQDLASDLLLSVSGRFFGMALNRFVLRPLFKTGADPIGRYLGKQAGRVFAEAVRDMVDGLEQRDLRVERKQLAVRTLQGYRPHTRGRGVRAVALPETWTLLPSGEPAHDNALPLTPRTSSAGDRAILGMVAGPSAAQVQLLGVALPAPGTDERAAVNEYLRQAVQGRALQYVRFNPVRGVAQRGLVMLPNEKLVLNLELLRQGLARYDASDPAVAVTFPELAQAAKVAMSRGTGFAARWRSDAVYRESLTKADADVWGGLGVGETPRRDPAVWGGRNGTGQGQPARDLPMIKDGMHVRPSLPPRGQ